MSYRFGYLLYIAAQNHGTFFHFHNTFSNGLQFVKLYTLGFDSIAGHVFGCGIPISKWMIIFLGFTKMNKNKNIYKASKCEMVDYEDW